MRYRSVILGVAAALAAGPALAHGDDTHATRRHTVSDADATAFGRPGDPATVSRTVNVAMSDAMRFSPSRVTVRKGETVRFVLRNEGAVLHEMVLGTDEELRKHAELMRRFPEMEHAEANMAHVKPGATGEVVWTFDKPGRFSFACLIPGHFEAGMKGQVEVK
jgi:uncharacterized cupredoxin-like copper-binding protein